MKVLFTFGGLPHYLNPILSRLNDVEGLDIVVAIPQKHSKTFGDGVKQSNNHINFKIIYLKEKKALYGNYYLSGLHKAIIDNQIDTIVTIWPYILNFVWDFRLQRLIKRNNIPLLLKEIPFDVPTYADTFEYYKSDYALQLNEDLIKKKISPFTFAIKHLLLRSIRKFYYSKLLTATICYTEKGIELASSFGLAKQNVFISYNSTDTDLLYEAKKNLEQVEPILNDSPHRILHVGRLVKWKRVDLIIEAVAKLKPDFPKIELVVIGKGKERKCLEIQSKSLSLEDNVKFVGGVYGDIELGNYFRSSALYVLAGMGGLSINQAMLFEKPIICSIADGTEKHLVREGKNGLYFENGNAEDLALKIKALLNNQETIRSFGQESARIIREEINVHTVIEAYLKAFNHVKQHY